MSLDTSIPSDSAKAPEVSKGPKDPKDPRVHERPSLQSISVIKISTSRVLFVGDSRAATVFAFELPAGEAPAGSMPYNLRGIDQKIASRLGVTVDALSIRDMAVDPLTQEAYIGVHRGQAAQAVPVIVRVRQDGTVTPVDVSALPFSKVTLENPANPDLVLKNGVAARTLAITDIAVLADEILIAGLSSADFASTLYRAPYPFGAGLTTSTVEIYHAVHNLNETRAPIRTMTAVQLDGQPHVLAAYTCTPLVTIPLASLQAGAHVKGKTIAELGFGNTPADILRFQSPDGKGGSQEFVLITHKHRGPMVFALQTLAESNAKEGLSKPAGFNVIAPPFMPVSMGGVCQVADQDAQFLVTLRRDGETGRLDLLSMRKGLYFRLSDHVSEYILPGFVYSPEQAGTKRFQDMMWGDELQTPSSERPPEPGEPEVPGVPEV